MQVNILVIIVLAFGALKILSGYQKGMVKEIISFVSLIFLCLTILLVGSALSSYHDHKFLNVAVMIVLLCVLGIVHHLVNLVVLPAKLLAKLPIVHSVDKILGVIVGFLETILILWTVYTFTMLMNLGMIGEFILGCTASNPVLTWLYGHNQVAGWFLVIKSAITSQL